MLTNVALLRAKPGQAEALGSALTGLVEPSRRDAGCISYDLHQSLEDANSWFIYENWRSTEDFDAHMQTAHLQEFLKLSPSLLQGDIDLRGFTMTSKPGPSSSFSGRTS
jgi:quinol monooxygenase YgiN